MKNPLIQFIALVVVVIAVAAVAAKSPKGAIVMSSPQPSASLPLPSAKTQATIATSKGAIVIEFFPQDAPKAVTNFVELAKKGYYNGLIFHRVIKGFMNQTGDPQGTGSGGQSIWGTAFADELDPKSPSYKAGYKDGVVAMANAGPNTNGSQFFIMAADYDLPHNYTIFGHVVDGLDVVHTIDSVPTDSHDKPLTDVTIQQVTIKE